MLVRRPCKISCSAGRTHFGRTKNNIMYFRFANGIVEKLAKKIAERIAKKTLMYVRFVKVERIA